jgi:protein phosphatase 4 regulatory subunit 3
MKDMIKHCMTRHEPEIRRLAETPLGGPRFISFIRRWEMNNEPLPIEESKNEQYVILVLRCKAIVLKSSLRPVESRRWPGQGRIIEAEEEDYFNTDDDDDNDILPSISSQYIRGQAPSPGNPLKRKRRGMIANASRGFRSLPGVRLRSLSPPLGSLVDYGEDDDDLGEIGPVGENISGLSSPSIPRQKPPSPSMMEIPSSPFLSQRQTLPATPPRRPSADDDDDDNVLSKLMRSSAPSPSPSLGTASLSMGPLRLSEKRRRDEDEDDGTLERLSKSKRSDVPQQTAPSPGSRIGSTKPGDDPPKKIKLKFSSMNLGKASMSVSTRAPSEGAKNVDTG